MTPVDDPLEQAAAALRSHNIEAIVVDTGAKARELVLGLTPDGAEVHSGKSRTLGEWAAGRTTVVLVREPVGV